ncbi:hypothetical protein R1sor_018390 [Riccia sorocarpa]|uniref:Uncharacterized protein n=1 Tax=Riccia sorocarpa TaxID=122646 RepID=A0ABD3I9M9_9MARC
MELGGIKTEASKGTGDRPPGAQPGVDCRIATWPSLGRQFSSPTATVVFHAPFIVEWSSLTSTRSRHCWRRRRVFEPDSRRMHASNLLKTVLKPRSITSSSSGQSLNPKDSKSRSGPRTSASEASLSLTVSQKPTAKMSCLCAPTNHAGSFRCRLHRGNQQSWGGRPVNPAPPAPPAPPKTTSTPAESRTPVSRESPMPAVDIGLSKRLLHHPTTRQHSSNNFSHPHIHRSCDGRPSRLSRVSVATEAETPAIEEPVVPVASSREAPGTVRYLKFTGGSGCASAAVLEAGVVAIKKLQVSSKKDVMLDVFGSETTCSGLKEGSLGRTHFDEAERTTATPPRKAISSKYEQGPLLRNVKCAW